MNVSQQILRRSVLAARCAARPGGLLLASRRYATEESDEESTPLTDYPKVPDISRQYLPPTGWHDNLMRRNFGDAVGEDLTIPWFLAYLSLLFSQIAS